MCGCFSLLISPLYRLLCASECRRRFRCSNVNNSTSIVLSSQTSQYDCQLTCILMHVLRTHKTIWPQGKKQTNPKQNTAQGQNENQKEQSERTAFWLQWLNWNTVPTSIDVSWKNIWMMSCLLPKSKTKTMKKHIQNVAHVKNTRVCEMQLETHCLLAAMRNNQAWQTESLDLADCWLTVQFQKRSFLQGKVFTPLSDLFQKLGAKVTRCPALKWKPVGMVDMQMTARKKKETKEKKTTSTEVWCISMVRSKC